MTDYALKAYQACLHGNADPQQQQSAASQIILLRAEVGRASRDYNEAREMFDLHVAWASDQAAVIERQVDALGEALYLMSGPLKASGFLDNEENHRIYENVVAAFREIGWVTDDAESTGRPELTGQEPTQ